MNAADVMTTRVITVFADTSVREVARILHTNRISAVPVVDARDTDWQLALIARRR